MSGSAIEATYSICKFCKKYKPEKHKIQEKHYPLEYPKNDQPAWMKQHKKEDNKKLYAIISQNPKTI